MDPASGLISGTPAVAGVFSVTLSAANAGGAGNGPLALTLVAPTVNLAAGGTGVAAEDGARGVVLVTRTGDLSLPLTITYRPKGSARMGVDYKALPGVVTIPAGAAKTKIKIKPIDGSPDAGTLKVKIIVQPAADGSFVVGTGTAKIKLIGR